MEKAARNALVALLRKRETLISIAPASASAAEQKRIGEALRDLAANAVKSDQGALRGRFLHLGARVEIGNDVLKLSISGVSLARLVCGQTGHAEETLALSLPFTIRKRGVDTKLVVGGATAQASDPALIRLLADARSWMHRLEAREFPSVRALARQINLDHRHPARALPLAFLAPDIVAAIMDGRQPPELTITAIKRLDPFPHRWDEQRAALGFNAAN